MARKPCLKIPWHQEKLLFVKHPLHKRLRNQIEGSRTPSHSYFLWAQRFPKQLSYPPSPLQGRKEAVSPFTRWANGDQVGKVTCGRSHILRSQPARPQVESSWGPVSPGVACDGGLAARLLWAQGQLWSQQAWVIAGASPHAAS